MRLKINRVLPVLAAGAALAFGAAQSHAVPTVSQLDDPSDLDLSLVEYALQFRATTTGAAGPVSGVTFAVVTETSQPTGVTATSGPGQKSDFLGVDYEFGPSADQNALETIAEGGWIGTIHPTEGPQPVNVSLALAPGAYKLQLIMLGTAPVSPARPGDYTIEGTTTTLLTPGVFGSGDGVDYVSLVTENLTVNDGSLDVSIIWTGAAGTNAPILSGLIVNAVPEPASLSLLALGGLGLLRRRRRV